MQRVIPQTLIVLLLALYPVSGRAHSPVDEQIVGVLRQLADDPTNASLYFRLGELHRLRHDWDQALGAFNRAEQLDPSLPTVELCRGITLYEAGRLVQAQRVMDRLVMEHPDVGAVWLARARVLVAQGLPAEAAADFAKSIRLAATPDPERYVERAQALAATDPARAVGGLEEGIKRLGPLVMLELPALELDVNLQRYDAALQRVDALAAQSPRQEDWLCRRGEILEQAGRPAEARVAWTAAWAALETLPPHRRHVPSVEQLAVTIQSALRRLDVEPVP